MKGSFTYQITSFIVLALVVVGGIYSFIYHSTLYWGYVDWFYLIPLMLSIWNGQKKGRWVLGFWLAFFLGWIGFVITLIIPASQEHKLSTTHRECPHCKEMMRKDATVCPHCQRDVSPRSL